MSESPRGAVWRSPAARIAAALLLCGALLLPLLIYLCGVTFLGSYDGASLAKTYATVYVGLTDGSASSWIVVLGPCLLFLLFYVMTRLFRVGL